MNMYNFRLNSLREIKINNNSTSESDIINVKKQILNKINEDKNINSITLEIKEKDVHKKIINKSINSNKLGMLAGPIFKMIKQNNK